MKNLIIAISLILTALSTQISQSNINRLRNTHQINFTYYFQYEYPLPDVFEVALAFEKVSSNLTQTFAELQDMDKHVKEQAGRWNGKIFVKEQDDSLEISFGKETNVFATMMVEMTDEQSLVGFLDSIVGLKDVKVLGVTKTRSSRLNFQIEDVKAKEAAAEESKRVCQQYFGMKYQQTIIFDKVVQENKSEQMVASYLQVTEKLELSKLQGFIEENAFFKCQIICRNQQYLSGRNKHQHRKQRKKIDIARAEQIARSNVAQKTLHKKLLQKEKVAGNAKSKKTYSDQL